MKPVTLYESELFVPFHLADPAGCLFYGNLAHLAHQCLEEGIQKIGIPWAIWFAHPEWAVPIRKLNSEFLAPMLAGETYQRQLQLCHVGVHSLQFVTQFLKLGKLCASSHTTHVFINKATGKKCAVPIAIKQRLPTP